MMSTFGDVIRTLYFMICIIKVLSNDLTRVGLIYKYKLQEYQYAVVTSNLGDESMDCSEICDKIGFHTCIKPDFNLKEKGAQMILSRLENSIVLTPSQVLQIKPQVMRLNSNECFCQQSFKANLTYSDPYNELLIELDDIREKSISLSTKMYIALHSNIFDGSCIKISNWLNITTKFLKSQEAFLKLKKELTKEGKFQVIHFYQNLKEIKKNYDKTIPELFDVLHYVISLEEKKLNYYQDKRERAEKAGMSTAECMKLNHVIFKIQEKIKLLKNIRDRWLQLVGSELWDFSARLFNIRFLYVKKESSAKHLCFQGYTEN